MAAGSCFVGAREWTRRYQGCHMYGHDCGKESSWIHSLPASHRHSRKRRMLHAAAQGISVATSAMLKLRRCSSVLHPCSSALSFLLHTATLISVSWPHAQTRAGIECRPRALHPSVSIPSHSLYDAFPLRTWALDVADNAAGRVVHELDANLGHTTTRACTLSDQTVLLLLLSRSFVR